MEAIMKNKKLTQEELNKIIEESADEFSKEVIKESENISEDESKEIDRILAIEDPTERIKELQKLYSNVKGIGNCQ